MIVHKVPEEQRKQSVDTMKVTKDVLDYLHSHGCETIEDFIRCQNELDPDIKGRVNGFLIFGLTL